MGKNIFYKITLFILFFAFAIPVYAKYQDVYPGDTITLGEFVYDDDYTATTTPCTITIVDSNDVVKVNGSAMTASTTGWHYYDYSVASNADLGVWSSFMSCGSVSGGDLVKVDKSFNVLADPIVSSSTIATAVWNADTRTLSTFGSLIADIATAVWNAGTKTLTSFGTLAADVWTSGTRTLTGVGTSGLATQTDINNASSSIVANVNSNTDTQISNASSSINANIDAEALAINTNIDAVVATVSNASSSIVTEILANRTLINNLNDISVADVWDRASSSLTTAGSIGKLLVDNIDAQISSRGTSSMTASDVWNYATRTLSDYATSTISSAVASAVWNNSTRDLSSYGNDITAQEVWDVLTTSLVTVDSVGKLLADNIDQPISTRASIATQEAGWNIIMSSYSSVQTGKTYRAKIQILNEQSVAENPFGIPTVTLYDANRNIVVSNVPMTSLGTGLYEYTYSISSGASQGVWETVVSTEVESGKVIKNNDYWLVSGSPAQVIINGVSGYTPTATANLTITNEGLAGYEYQYEWCVVSDTNNSCGGGDDIYRGTGAKFINPGDDWNTNLTATVPTAGDYIFKVIVYFGTEKSGSSRTFTINNSTTPPAGGGGGGSGSTDSNAGVCKGADFNKDDKVNSIDFSILLAFWKTLYPFKNPCVDINQDKQVNSIDFSILLSQWGTKGKSI